MHINGRVSTEHILTVDMGFGVVQNKKLLISSFGLICGL